MADDDSIRDDPSKQVYDDPDNQLDNPVPEPSSNADAASPSDPSQTPYVPLKDIDDDASPLDEVEEPVDTQSNHQEDEDAYNPGEDQLRNVTPPEERDDTERA